MVDVLFVTPLLEAWGGWIVFLTATLEAMPFVGMLVPGQAVIVLASLLAAQGEISIWPLFWGGVAGGVVGDGIGYLVGHRYGRGLLIEYGPRFRIEAKHVEKADELFAKYGPGALILARFSFLTRGLGPMLAGMTHMRPAIFWPLNVIGAFLWAAGYIGVGFLAGGTLAVLESIVGRALAFGLLFALGVYVLYRLLKKANALFTGEDAALAALAALAIVLFARLADAVFKPGTLVVDAMRGEVMAALAPAVPLWRAFDVLGSFYVLAPLGVTLVAVLTWRRKYWDASLFAAALVGNEIIVNTLKTLLARPRPFGGLVEASGFAFPSGHTASAVVFVGAAVYVLVRRFPSVPAKTATIVVGAAAVAGMGLSRVALGVHYPSDVFAGLLVGVAWLFTVLLVVEYVVKRTPGARPRR